MVNSLLIQGRALAVCLANLKTWLDSLLVRADGLPPGDRSQSGLPTWVIPAVIVVVLLCLLPVCILVLVTMLLPVLSNIFQDQTLYI
jgi:hypothetical protein